MYKELTKPEIKNIADMLRGEVVYNTASEWCECFLRDPQDSSKPLRLFPLQKEWIDGNQQDIKSGRRQGRTLAMLCRALYEAFTSSKKTILFVTPSTQQTQYVCDLLDKLLVNTWIQLFLSKPTEKLPYEKFNITTISELIITTVGCAREIAAEFVILDNRDTMPDIINHGLLSDVTTISVFTPEEFKPTKEQPSIWFETITATPEELTKWYNKQVTMNNEVFTHVHYRNENGTITVICELVKEIPKKTVCPDFVEDHEKGLLGGK